METQGSPQALAVLGRAREHVRTRWRSARYYQAGDRFSELFLGTPFRVPPDVARAVGTDYSAIDWLYEALGGGDARALASLETVTARLQAMAEPTGATAALPSLEEALHDPTCPLLDVSRALVGAVTVLGNGALEARGAGHLVPSWLRLWAGALQTQNHQQASLARMTGVMRAPPEEQPGLLALLGGVREELTVRATGFAAGVDEYLERFSETGAATVALVGGLPFSGALSVAGLEALLALLTREPDFLGRMARLLRLAQDVRFDPTEPLNSGVMGHVAERGLSLLSPQAAPEPGAALDARLRAVWEAHQAESQRYFEARVASLQEATLKATLQRFVTTLQALASRLAATGHDVTPST